MLKSKFISNVLSVGSVCSCVATMSCSAKEETKEKKGISVNKFRGLEFGSTGKFIDFLIQLVRYFSRVPFDNPGNKSISERLKSAIGNFYWKESVIEEFKKLNKAGYIELDVGASKAHEAYKTPNGGYGYIEGVFRKSGVYNYRFDVSDFKELSSEDFDCKIMHLCSLEVNDIGITLKINAGNRPFKESAYFGEENSQEKIANIVKKVKMLIYIFSKLEGCEHWMCRGVLFFSEKVDNDGNVVFSPKRRHNVVLKDDASNAVKRVSSLVFKPCGEFEIGFDDEEQTQKYDITNFEDLEKLTVLMGKFKNVSNKTYNTINTIIADQCLDSVAQLFQ